MKFSAVMNVYNEELCLGCCLDSLMPVLDELIIVDGSEDGPSTDGTRAIIDRFSYNYPGRIIYIFGTFRNERGGWNAVEQWNMGLERVTGNFVMRTAADIIYDYEDAIMAREIAESFPEKKYFYSPILEFSGDTRHIQMQGVLMNETSLLRPLCSHPVWVLSSLGLYCFRDEFGREGGSTKIGFDWSKETIFMPHVKRFHFAYVKPFDFQVSKIIKYILSGEYGETSIEFRDKGDRAIMDYAIDAARRFTDQPNKMPYTGLYPKVAESLRSMTNMDGYDAFMEKYNAKYSFR